MTDKTLMYTKAPFPIEELNLSTVNIEKDRNKIIIGNKSKAVLETIKYVYSRFITYIPL